MPCTVITDWTSQASQPHPPVTKRDNLKLKRESRSGGPPYLHKLTTKGLEIQALILQPFQNNHTDSTRIQLLPQKTPRHYHHRIATHHHRKNDYAPPQQQ
eukprot:2196275-Ditylum_brightwellii.AAC.1